VNPAIELTPAVGQAAKVQASNQQAGVVGEPGPGAMVPAPSSMQGQANRQMRAQPDSMVPSAVVQAEEGLSAPRPTQIVVILRPKSRGQQTPSNQVP